MRGTTKVLLILFFGSALTGLIIVALEKLTGLNLGWAVFIAGFIWGYILTLPYFQALEEENKPEKD